MASQNAFESLSTRKRHAHVPQSTISQRSLSRKWYQKLIEDLQPAGKAKCTVSGYVRAVRKLAEFSTSSRHSNWPNTMSAGSC